MQTIMTRIIFIAFLFSFLILSATASHADVVIDNSGTGTSYTGSWYLSGGTDPYGASSLWSRNGATYTFSMSGQQAGVYEVLIWWSDWSSRAPAVPVTVNYTGGARDLTVNQRENAGKWNTLGTFYFDGSGFVTITAANDDTLSSCADAVQFRFITTASPPVAVIDSVTPSPAQYGESVVFTGHGTDSDGTIIRYQWTSSLDGALSLAHSFSTAALSVGTHTISFVVEDDTGLTSSAATITLSVGSASEEVIIDNSDYTRTSRVGTWSVSTAPDYYQTGSVWSRDGATFTWRFTPEQTGNYNVSMWWTTTSTRSSSIPVTVNYSGGSRVVAINQLQNAGQWNFLGTYPFLAGTTYNITITSQAYPTSTCADAMKFTRQTSGPIAVIDSISPNPALYGSAVAFTGHGTGGTITGYEWTSSIDGTIGNAASFWTSSLSSGAHAITFRVKDNTGAISSAAVASLIIDAAGQEVIIDNSDYTRTSRVGTWSVSTAPDYYQTGSVWSRDGATFTWRFTPEQTGNYNVSMWWTTTSTRSSSIPVTVNYSGGSRVVAINQLQNAGQWNFLGTYPFLAGTPYNIMITSQAYPTSTCADAVSFRLSSSGVPRADFTSDMTTGSPPFTIQFTDLSSGAITSWLWNFGDGTTSTAMNPAHTYTTAGKYTVTLTVSNVYGSDTKTIAQYIDVTGVDVEHIYIGDGYSEDAVFVPNIRRILTELGATSTNDTWYYTNNATGKSYVVHFVNTPSGFLTALKQTRAHIIWNGHSNFGLGGSFAQGDEVYRQQIDDIRYIDDDRFTHISTPMVSVKIDGMTYGQAYPNWEPVFKDGTNGIMPYTFSEGIPPYNYYLTYKVPGDLTLYRIELADGTYLQRFPDSGVPPWFSPSGLAPDPLKNPEYFIVNNDTDFNRCDFTGTWPTAVEDNDEYRGYNYQYHAAGSGSYKATWTVVVKTAGTYDVLATWQSSSLNASNASYTIRHSGGSSTVVVDQRVRTWGYKLGTYYFAAGTYTITLTDNADGRVVADSIRLASASGATAAYADNTFHCKPHYFAGSSGKTIIYGNKAIAESDLKFARMFYSSCNSCNYYCGNFHRGIMYCTTSDSDLNTGLTYFKDYISGMSDDAILVHLNTEQNIHELIDFNLKPPSLR